MSATVQATCPGCRNVLRIPAGWVDKALKCKKCGTVVQARRRSAAPAEPPPAAAPVPAPAPASDLAFAAAGSPVTARYRGRTGSRLVPVAGMLLILAGTAAAGFALRDRILHAVGPKDSPDAAAADTAVAKGPAAKATDPFPRRLLFVHATKYLYFNTLAAGKDARGDDLAAKSAAKMAFELRVPTDKDNNQLFTLIDTAQGKDFRAPLKGTIRHAYEQFLATSRPQDRVVVYFGGHAVEKDGKAFLVPVEGEPDDPGTLVPLDEFYAKLKDCPARQKVVLFDVCRFNPGFGAAKPGSEPMGEKLAALLHAAPPGVQVVTSCSAGEAAQESNETGSEFLAAFRAVAGGAKAGKAAPGEPIPAGPWADALRAALGQARDRTAAQTPKLSGTEAPSGVAYNRDEPPARRFGWPAPEPRAAAAEVEAVLKLAALPGIRKELDLPPGLADVYPFPADRMKEYAAAEADDPAGHPVRQAAADALAFIRANWGTDGGLRESFEGAADEKVKRDIVKEQEPLAKLSLGLREQVKALEAVRDKLADEKSKRWRAAYQYALAQAQLRWAFMEEYNLSLGNIRTDTLQRPAAGANPVWRLVSVERMKSKKDVKEKAEAAKELLGEMAEEHEGTPWEVLAKMHRHVALGLDWKLVDAKAEK